MVDRQHIRADLAVEYTSSFSVDLDTWLRDLKVKKNGLLK